MQLIIDSKFRPFNYDDLIKPLNQYKEVYDKSEADYATLAAQTEQWKDVANQTQSPKAYSIYKSYSDALREASDSFSKGMTIQNRAALTRLKNQYATDITPIAKAATRREKLMEEQRKLSQQDPTRLWERQARDLSIDALMADGTLDYGRNYSGSLLTQQASQAAQHLAGQLRSYGKGKPIDAYTDTFIQKYGLSAADINDYLRGESTSSNKVLTAIYNQVMDSSGIKNWNNAEAEMAADGFIKQGMWAAIGKDTVQQIENYGARKALDLANSIKLAEKQHELANSQLPADNNLPIDPRSFYTSEQEDLLNNSVKYINRFKKYFYEKDGKVYLTEKGREMYFTPAYITQTSPSPGNTRITVPTNSEFKDFIDAIGGKNLIGKNVKDKNWRPGDIGNLWKKYTTSKNLGDAVKHTEFNFPIAKSNMEGFTNHVFSAYGNNKIRVQSYDPESDTFKTTSTLDKATLTEHKAYISETQNGYNIITGTLNDPKTGEVFRIEIPRNLSEKTYERAVGNGKAALKMANKIKSISEQLGVDNYSQAYNAYMNNILHGKVLTENQKELIRQWNMLESMYPTTTQENHVTLGQIGTTNDLQEVKITPHAL